MKEANNKDMYVDFMLVIISATVLTFKYNALGFY